MSQDQQKFQQIMSQGHSAAWDQQWDEATAFYRQALEEIPDDPTALTSLGLALYQLRQYPEALACYIQAAECNPDDPLPLEKVGDIQELMGSLSQASDTLMKVAEVYARNRDIHRAIEIWTRVIQINPAYFVAHSRLALVYERLGKKTEAVKELLAMASLLQHAAEVTKAIQAVTHALQLVPNSDEAGEALALLRSGQPLPKLTRSGGDTGQLVKAQLREMNTKDLPNVKDEGPDPIAEARQKALTDLAGLIFDGGDDEPQEESSARRGVQSIVQGLSAIAKGSDRNKMVLHLTQAVDLQSRGQGAMAYEDLDRAVDAGLEHPAAFFDLGLLAMENGRMESAVRHLQKAVNHPAYALATRLLTGQIYLKTGRHAEAAVEYMEALRMADASVVPEEQAEDLRQQYDPLIEEILGQSEEVYTRISTNITDLLVRPGWKEKLAQARQQLPRTLEGDPPAPMAEVLTEVSGGKLVESIHRIHQLTRIGQFRAAMEEAYFALEQAPTYLPLHTYIGELLLQQNYPQFAMEKFNAVARAYSVRGQPNRAVDVYRRILGMDLTDMKVRTQLIDQLYSMGRFEDAVAETMKLGDVYYNLADRVSARKTYFSAYRLAQQSGTGRDSRADILYKVADLDMQSLDWRQAVKVFEQLRTLKPEDEKARTSLIDFNLRLAQTAQALNELDDYISYLFHQKKHDQAVTFVENLTIQYPKQPGIRRRMAELYRQSGRRADAIEQLDAAGDMLMEAGDRQGAVEAVMAILAMDPPNKEEYQKLLAQLGNRN